MEHFIKRHPTQGSSRGVRNAVAVPSETPLKTPAKKPYDLLAWGLWVAAFTLFLPAMKFSFLDYDDLIIMFERPQVFSGLSLKNLLWAFSTLHADFAYWMPITWISHQLDCQLFGRNAGAHHV